MMLDENSETPIRNSHWTFQVRSSGIAPKSSRNWALQNGSESLKQQQVRAKGLRHTCQKNCRTLALESIKNKSIALESIKNKSITLRHRKKHFDYSQRRSSVIGTKSSRNLALENGSESLKQQQDSYLRHAKHKPIKLSKRRLRNPLKRKKRKEKR